MIRVRENGRLTTVSGDPVVRFTDSRLTICFDPTDESVGYYHSSTSRTTLGCERNCFAVLEFIASGGDQ